MRDLLHQPTVNLFVRTILLNVDLLPCNYILQVRKTFCDLDNLEDIQLPSGYILPDFSEEEEHSDNLMYDLFQTEWRSIKEIWITYARSFFRAHKNLNLISMVL